MEYTQHIVFVNQSITSFHILNCVTTCFNFGMRINVLGPRIIAIIPQYDIVVRNWRHSIDKAPLLHEMVIGSLTGIVQPKFTYHILILKKVKNQQQGDSKHRVFQSIQVQCKCKAVFLVSDNFCRTIPDNREFKQITTAGATTAAVTEKVWGEYVSPDLETTAKEFKISFQFSVSQPNGFAQRTMAVIRLPRTKRLFLTESECHTLCT